ncbi:copper transporter [Romboutsia sp.]|uniref:copper transporter n=1 Tax=Romboutsia sp. TaxID=1965302 RepID=UPI003F2AD282
MHINMKYYIVTIGAIFLALGIGMLVGFNLNYDQELSKQQASIIDDLDNKFEDLKIRNDNLEKSLSTVSGDYDKAIKYINENSDKLIVDELLEKNIGIISTNQNNDYIKEINETIAKAGGNIAFDIVLKNNIYNEKKIGEVSTKLDLNIKNTQDIMKYIVESLKSEDAKEKLKYLEELDIIKVNSIGDNYINYDSVVLGSGSQDKNVNFGKIDKLLLSALKQENKKIVAVQKSEHNSSYIDLYSKDKVTTVDNIDQGSGKLSLVMILKEGNISGRYGILEGADSIIPYKK